MSLVRYRIFLYSCKSLALFRDIVQVLKTVWFFQVSLVRLGQTEACSVLCIIEAQTLRILSSVPCLPGVHSAQWARHSSPRTRQVLLPMILAGGSLPGLCSSSPAVLTWVLGGPSVGLLSSPVLVSLHFQLHPFNSWRPLVSTWVTPLRVVGWAIEGFISFLNLSLRNHRPSLSMSTIVPLPDSIKKLTSIFPILGACFRGSGYI